MKIVVAMDSFKGNMTAREACERVRDGIRTVHPPADIVLIPMADGGEGTAAALMTARGGVWVEMTVMGPLPEQQVSAGYAWLEETRTAVVEMAAASGITLLDRSQLDPLKTTTYGTGQLIAAAIKHGAERLLLAVGGSATVDGGVGAAMALGWQFLDEGGESIGLGGEALTRLVAIQPPAERCGVPVEVLCDVENPLTGPEGAAAVFGPQKGATPEMVDVLDRGLKHLAECVRAQLNKEIDHLPGAGAAGGLAAGAVAFCDGLLVPGIDTVMADSGLEEQLAAADWVISGEGRFDLPSLQGKVVSGILRMARKSEVKVGVIAGSVKVDEANCRANGLSFAWPTAPADRPMEQAIRTAKEDLQATAARFAETYL